MSDPAWDYELFWKEALNQIQQDVSAQEFEMWFRNMVYHSSRENEIVVNVPSSFYRDQVAQRYLSRMETILYELSGHRMALTFDVQPRAQSRTQPRAVADSSAEHGDPDKGGKAIPPASPSTRRPPRSRQAPHPNLNTDYIFERFVIGENNSFAANAALAISKNPGTAYNPCLIYGGVGLGKTHLLQAIGNEAYSGNAELKVSYVTAETFTNEFILSIGEKTSHRFKNKYRSVDILLIDDFHFPPGKRQTQEELFHTFNALHDANKQLIFTCDRPVSELRDLTDRLKSRFGMGLNVDLQPPEYETRIAILNKKIQEKGAHVPTEVVELVGRNVQTNVRDLERALTKLLAYAELVNQEINIDIAQRQLQDYFANPGQRNVSTERIQRVVAEYFNLSHGDMRGKKRTKAIAFPRQIAMYITREMTELSTTEIGANYGGRDHTTVMHACQRIEDRMKTDPTLEPTIRQLIRSIRSEGG